MIRGRGGGGKLREELSRVSFERKHNTDESSGRSKAGRNPQSGLSCVCAIGGTSQQIWIIIPKFLAGLTEWVMILGFPPPGKSQKDREKKIEPTSETSVKKESLVSVRAPLGFQRNSLKMDTLRGVERPCPPRERERKKCRNAEMPNCRIEVVGMRDSGKQWKERRQGFFFRRYGLVYPLGYLCIEQV